MNLHNITRGTLLIPFSIPILLAGCAMTPAGPTVGVMPGKGKSFAAFQADNAVCKSFAADQVRGQADAANQRATGTALLTTVLGTGLGAATGGLVGDAGGGAAVGAAAGLGGGALLGAGGGSAEQAGIQQQYDNAFSQCMYSKGDQVPGYLPGTYSSGGVVSDPTVRAAQVELNRLGYLSDPADGVAGSHTRAAVSTFEQANGLPVDGAVTSTLLARLQATPSNSASAAPANWVAPTGSPPPPSAKPAAGWVAPVNAAATTPQTATAAPSGWVAPTKSP